MYETQLFGGCGRDSVAQFGEFLRFVGANREPECIGVHDHETVPAVGGIDRQGSEAGDFKRRVKSISKGRHISDGDALSLAVPAIGPDRDQSAGCLELELRDRLDHGDDPAIQQHGRYADRIRPRHWRSIRRFHDDEAHRGARILRRNQEVHVPEHAAARFVQNEIAKGFVFSDLAGLLPKCFAGRGCDTTDDDIADFTLGMTADDMDGLGRTHVAPAGLRNC